MERGKETIKNFSMITLGIAIYSFGFTKFNMANHLAEGGIAGITLIFKALFNINPAFSNLILNAPLILLAAKILGKKMLGFAAFAVPCLSFFMYFWQELPITVDVSHDMLIASILSGIFSGVGGGLVLRSGGIIGGGDIIARLAQHWFGMPLSRALLLVDGVVLAL
ncbi:MAG: YitT family protein, partial [Streptococcaceae bacterium]|nr:YitT family protein [Streptococcaceae bacterium]